MTRALALAVLVLLAAVTPATAATAPGRIAFSVGSPGAGPGSEPETAPVAVSLPGGSVLTFSHHANGTAFALKLTRGGSLDPSFGNGGIARLDAPVRALQVGQAEPLADGRVLIAATSGDLGSTVGAPRIVLLRLLPSGAPDPSFGTAGVVVTSIGSPDRGAPLAVAPDGSIVLTGSVLTPGETNPLNPATTDWAVTRLTPAGALDASFGVARIPVGSGRRAEGRSVALAPDGSIVVLGQATQYPGNHPPSFALAGLTATGTPDPGFNGGAPVLVPLGAPYSVRHRGSAFEVVSNTALMRFTAGGSLDTSFATNGTLTFDRYVLSYLATPDGGALLQVNTRFSGPIDIDRRHSVLRVTADGAIAGSAALYTPFGGGAPGAGPVKQNTFTGRLVRRDDGSLLAIGGLSIFTPAGDRYGLTAPFFAAAAFTPGLTPDPSFGGPPPAARLGIQVRAQRALTAARRGYVALRVTAPQPGLAFLRIRDPRGRILGSSRYPFHATGASIQRVRLTGLGKRILRRARKGLRIAIGHEYRDIVAVGSSGVTRGRLR